MASGVGAAQGVDEGSAVPQPAAGQVVAVRQTVSVREAVIVPVDERESLPAGSTGVDGDAPMLSANAPQALEALQIGPRSPQADAVQPYGPTRRSSRGTSEESRRVVEEARTHEEMFESRMRGEMQTFMLSESSVCRRYLYEMRQAGEEARAYYERMAESHVSSAEARTRELLERAQQAHEVADRRAHQSWQGEEAVARAAREQALRHEEQHSEFAATNDRVRGERDFAQHQCEFFA